MFRRQILKVLTPSLRGKSLGVRKFNNNYKVQSKCYNSMNHLNSYSFFNLFQSKSKPVFEKYRNDIAQVINKVDEENDLEQKENFIFEAFQLFSDAKEQELLTEEEICTHLQSIFDDLESKIDAFSGWNEDSLYNMKFLLLQAFYEYKNEEKVERYIREFTSDYFIENIFQQFQTELQIIFTIYFSQLLAKKGDQQNAIRICEKFLKDLVVEDQISFPAYQQIYVILIQLYKSLNMHTQSFNLIEEATRLISSEKYAQDFSYIPSEQAMNPLNEILFLIDYCYEYQQYELAYKLGDNVLSFINSNQNETFDNISYDVNLLKNLNKHYKILLAVNIQIQNLQGNIDQEVEEKFIKSLEKFLNYQDQYNQNKINKSKSLNLPQIIEKNLHKFSSDTKHQILKIAHKFDILSK